MLMPRQQVQPAKRNLHWWRVWVRGRRLEYIVSQDIEILDENVVQWAQEI